MSKVSRCLQLVRRCVCVYVCVCVCVCVCVLKQYEQKLELCKYYLHGERCKSLMNRQVHLYKYISGVVWKPSKHGQETQLCKCIGGIWKVSKYEQEALQLCMFSVLMWKMSKPGQEAKLCKHIGGLWKPSKHAQESYLLR